MKILVIGYEATSKYSGIFCSNFCDALDHIGADHDRISPNDNILDFPGYDLYIGAGDELLRKSPGHIADIKSIGGIAIDIRTKKLPNKPKTWLKALVEPRKFSADYVFTHMRDRRKNCFHIGQGLDDTILYPEQDETFTVYVDHYMPNRSAKVQAILNQCQTLLNNRRNVRIWYHSSDGIVENVFNEDKTHYQLIPYSELAAYYRKTHVFLPTHRETQGIVAAEIGMCGGVTLLEKWMYPQQTLENIAHEIYRNQINWPESVDIKANMAYTKKHYSKDAFANRIKSALEAIAAKEL